MESAIGSVVAASPIQTHKAWFKRSWSNKALIDALAARAVFRNQPSDKIPNSAFYSK